MCDLVFVDDDDNLGSVLPDSLPNLTYDELVDRFPYYPERSTWKMRVDIHQEQYGNITVEQCLNVLRDSEIYMYAVEKADSENPHFQAVVVTSVRKDTVVARIKKLGAKGSGYAYKKTKEQWPIEMMAYLLKEGNPHYHNLPIEVQLAVEKRQDKVRQNFLDKKAEKKKNPVWCKIMHMIPEDFDYHGDYAGIKVMKYVIKYHKDNMLVIRRGNLIAYMDTILLHKTGDGYENIYISNLLKN